MIFHFFPHNSPTQHTGTKAIAYVPRAASPHKALYILHIPTKCLIFALCPAIPGMEHTNTGRPMHDNPLLLRITIDPDICHGQPCIRHLRYPVSGILEYLAGGDTVADILAEHTDLEQDDILACFAFAALATAKRGGAFIPFAA